MENGVGGSCVITGPSGIGKTALLAAALDEAERNGIRVLRARGSELEGTLSFGAVRDLLGPAVVRLSVEEQADLMRDLPASRGRSSGSGRARTGIPSTGCSGSRSPWPSSSHCF